MVMRALTAALAAALLVAAAGPSDPRVAQRFMSLTRATTWTPVAAIRLSFPTFHPQGMVRIGDTFYLSSVEILTLPKKLPAPVDGHAYDTGAGVGHLFKIAADGRLLADLRLGEGSVYHPGGIDYDGRSIWVPVAEYRPDSRAIVYRVDPATMTATKVLTVADHIGGVVHDVEGQRLVGVNWGSRRVYGWPVGADGAVGKGAAPVANPGNYIDWQDCHYAGGRRMLCAGVADYRVRPDGPAFQLGGVDLVDLSDLRPVWQAPVALWAPSGRAMTQNPFWMEATATGLRAYFVPDDDESTLFVFDAAGQHGSHIVRPGPQ